MRTLLLVCFCTLQCTLAFAGNLSPEFLERIELYTHATTRSEVVRNELQRAGVETKRAEFLASLFDEDKKSSETLALAEKLMKSDSYAEFAVGVALLNGSPFRDDPMKDYYDTRNLERYRLCERLTNIALNTMPEWKVPPDLLSNVQVVVDGFPSEEEKEFVESLAYEKLTSKQINTDRFASRWLIIVALNNGFPEELLNEIWQQPVEPESLFRFTSEVAAYSGDPKLHDWMLTKLAELRDAKTLSAEDASKLHQSRYYLERALWQPKVRNFVVSLLDDRIGNYKTYAEHFAYSLRYDGSMIPEKVNQDAINRVAKRLEKLAATLRESAEVYPRDMDKVDEY